MCVYIDMYTHLYLILYQYVPHKAVAEVSRQETYRRGMERLVPVNDGWQSQPTDGSKSGWTECSVGVVVVVVAM